MINQKIHFHYITVLNTIQHLITRISENMNKIIPITKITWKNAFRVADSTIIAFYL